VQFAEISECKKVELVSDKPGTRFGLDFTFIDPENGIGSLVRVWLNRKQAGNLVALLADVCKQFDVELPHGKIVTDILQ